MINVVVNYRAINNGLRGDPDNCPLALAIRESVGYITTVGETICTLWNDDKTTRIGFYHLPEKAVEFRKRFDRGDKVKPFTFQLANKITARKKEMV